MPSASRWDSQKQLVAADGERMIQRRYLMSHRAYDNRERPTVKSRGSMLNGTQTKRGGLYGIGMACVWPVDTFASERLISGLIPVKNRCSKAWLFPTKCFHSDIMNEGLDSAEYKHAPIDTVGHGIPPEEDYDKRGLWTVGAHSRGWMTAVSWNHYYSGSGCGSFRWGTFLDGEARNHVTHDHWTRISL